MRNLCIALIILSAAVVVFATVLVGNPEDDFKDVDPILLGAGNKPEVEGAPDLSKAMPLPWSMQRAAAYARVEDEKKRGV